MFGIINVHSQHHLVTMPTGLGPICICLRCGAYAQRQVRTLMNKQCPGTGGASNNRLRHVAANKHPARRTWAHMWQDQQHHEVVNNFVFQHVKVSRLKGAQRPRQLQLSSQCAGIDTLVQRPVAETASPIHRGGGEPVRVGPPRSAGQ